MWRAWLSRAVWSALLVLLPATSAAPAQARMSASQGPYRTWSSNGIPTYQNDSLRGVACVDDQHCLAVGSTGSLAYNTSGTWAIYRGTGWQRLNGITCIPHVHWTASGLIRQIAEHREAVSSTRKMLLSGELSGGT